MVTPQSTATLHQQRGASMIEVLVTIVIVAFGLLGLAGLQARLQSSEMESYQRSQALLLLGDMANRMTLNRGNAAAYAAAAPKTSPLGVGTCPTATSSVLARDLKEWCEALQGAGETTGGNKVGAMIGGRGCVEVIGTREYLITVAWQGLTPISAPPDAVACGANSFDTVGSSCDNDLCRRTVTTVVQIANLS